jgi:hypothetical protein
VNIEDEVAKVNEFAKPLNAIVEIHFEYPTDNAINRIALDELIKANSGPKIKLHIEKIDLTESLILNIRSN